ncbi:N-acyl homoserine lactonase family protein [Pseudonocardia kujensis]|uniref:N-acyl homoserine lactonase family protein n=1 Tax=Pseudonocardia kujensis TaxID=1128675 RepID=UPI001E28F185|nr:N-acyl homoserine lactonase family protein [Pseudonocardia kujensis]MCE0765059.1 N-acyl homoserine lactonase family protein [Pseudonocardia kujensis]
MTTAKRLIPLAGGSITLDSGFLVMGGKEEITAPCPVFLIEHSRGLVLFDTGMAPDAWEDPRGVYGDLMDTLKLTLPAENRLDRQLANHGFTPADVTHVVISHGHFDHTGGLGLFPHAQIYMSLEDIRYAFWPDPLYSQFFGRADLDRARAYAWNPLSWDLDLFGDGSVQIIRTPGHTDGELSMVVKLPSRSFLITADAVHARDQLATVMPCPVDMNASASVQSIHRINQLAFAHDAEIWVMHDPDDWARLGGTDCYS